MSEFHCYNVFCYIGVRMLVHEPCGRYIAYMPGGPPWEGDSDTEDTALGLAAAVPCACRTVVVCSVVRTISKFLRVDMVGLRPGEALQVWGVLKTEPERMPS